jgi:hypothetical protein
VTAGPRSPPCGPGAASRAAAALSCAAIALYSPQQLRMLHSEGAAILYTMQRRHHAAAAGRAVQLLRDSVNRRRRPILQYCSME